MKNPKYIFTLENTINNLVDMFDSGDVNNDYELQADGSIEYTQEGVATLFQSLLPENVDVVELCGNVYYAYAVYDSDLNLLHYERKQSKTDFPLYNRISFPDMAYISIEVDYNGVDLDVDNFPIIRVEKQYHPIVKDDLAISYEKESGEMFYRRKLDGSLRFIGKEYDEIKSWEIESKTLVRIYRESLNDYRDEGVISEAYWVGKFTKTDCKWNLDDKVVEVSPEVQDQYTDFLEHVDDEFDLVKLAPPITELDYVRRPVLQIYALGSNKITNIVSGMAIEQDVTEPCNDSTKLTANPESGGDTWGYGFARMDTFVWVDVDGYRYSGYLQFGINTTPDQNRYYKGDLYRDDDNTYRLNVNTYPDRHEGDHWTHTLLSLYHNNTLIGQTAGVTSSEYLDFFNTWGVAALDWGNETELSGNVFNLTNSHVVTTQRGNVALFFQRLLVSDRRVVSDVESMKLRIDDDLLPHNVNYPYCFAYGVKNYTIVSFGTTQTPTQYGLISNSINTYFADKGANYFPIAYDMWGSGSSEVSYWGDYSFYEQQAELWETKFFSNVTLKHAYKLRDAWFMMLQEVMRATNKEFMGSFYSQWLLNHESDGVTQFFPYDLFLTAKTNILKSNYSQPAMKGTCSLRMILNMLKNTMQLYWHIEINNNGQYEVHIEQLAYYMQGRSYSTNHVIGTSYDLTNIVSKRNGKDLAFLTNKFTFDKQEMPKEYAFGWMDDSTPMFNGFGIQLKSQFINKNKVEEVNVGNFTSDLDYMLALPDECSKDGWALLCGSSPSTLYTWKQTYSSTLWYSSSRNPQVNDYVYLGKTFTDANKWKVTQKSGDNLTIQFGESREEETKRLVYIRKVLNRYGWSVEGQSIPTYYTDDEHPLVGTRVWTKPVGDDDEYWFVTGFDSLVMEITNSPIQPLVRNVSYNGEQAARYKVPFYMNGDIMGRNVVLQNGYLAFAYLMDIGGSQYGYINMWWVGMPCKNIVINGENQSVDWPNWIKKTLTQDSLNFASWNDPDPLLFIKTQLGFGQIGKNSINLLSRNNKVTLNYSVYGLE